MVLKGKFIVAETGWISGTWLYNEGTFLLPNYHRTFSFSLESLTPTRKGEEWRQFVAYTTKISFHNTLSITCTFLCLFYSYTKVSTMLYSEWLSHTARFTTNKLLCFLTIAHCFVILLWNIWITQEDLTKVKRALESGEFLEILKRSEIS